MTPAEGHQGRDKFMSDFSSSIKIDARTGEILDQHFWNGQIT